MRWVHNACILGSVSKWVHNAYILGSVRKWDEFTVHVFLVRSENEFTMHNFGFGQKMGWIHNACILGSVRKWVHNAYILCSVRKWVHNAYILCSVRKWGEFTMHAFWVRSENEFTMHIFWARSKNKLQCMYFGCYIFVSNMNSSDSVVLPSRVCPHSLRYNWNVYRIVKRAFLYLVTLSVCLSCVTSRRCHNSFYIAIIFKFVSAKILLCRCERDKGWVTNSSDVIPITQGLSLLAKFYAM
jgi:hypothetical protein